MKHASSILKKLFLLSCIIASNTLICQDEHSNDDQVKASKALPTVKEFSSSFRSFLKNHKKASYSILFLATCLAAYEVYISHYSNNKQPNRNKTKK